MHVLPDLEFLEKKYQDKPVTSSSFRISRFNLRYLLYQTIEIYSYWNAFFVSLQFAVVGVHSAKFDNEKDLEAIRNAVLRYGVTHPVSFNLIPSISCFSIMKSLCCLGCEWWRYVYVAWTRYQFMADICGYCTKWQAPRTTSRRRTSKGTIEQICDIFKNNSTTWEKLSQKMRKYNNKKWLDNHKFAEIAKMLIYREN